MLVTRGSWARVTPGPPGAETIVRNFIIAKVAPPSPTRTAR